MADLITVTSGTAGNVGSTAAELQTYFYAKMLNVAEFNTILKQFGEMAPLPERSSLTIKFNRLEKFSTTASPSQLTQGVPPDADGLTINEFSAVVEQYGKLVRISEIAELTAKHPLIEATINRLGLHFAETYDILIYNVLDAATNEYRPNARAADTDLIGTDRPAYVDLVELNALLVVAGARPLGANGNYPFITSPQPYASLQQDPDWKASNQFAAASKIWRGQVGELANFDVVRSNSPAFAVTSQAGAGDADKVYSSFALGSGAFQVSDLQPMEMSVVAPGGHSDPLKQSYKLGYKFMFKSVITNQAWIRRVRTAGLNSVTNP